MKNHPNLKLRIKEYTLSFFGGVISFFFWVTPAYSQDFVADFDVSDEFDLVNEIEASVVGAIKRKEGVQKDITSLEKEVADSINLLRKYEALRQLSTESATGLGISTMTSSFSPPASSIAKLLSNIKNSESNSQENLEREKNFIKNPTQQTSLLATAKDELKQREEMLRRAKADENQDGGNQSFWDSKTLTFTGNFGIAVNPNKKAEQEGDTDAYFNPIVFGNLSKVLDDTDGKSDSSSVVSISGLLYAKDHFDNLGSDVEVTGVYASFSRAFNKCWSLSVTPGVEIITTDFYEKKLGTDVPLKAQITRKFYDKFRCSGDLGGLDSQASLRYTKTFSDPSTGNRDEWRLTYSKNIKLNKDWSATFAPTLKHTIYTNLDGDADLNNTDIQLPISLSRKIYRDVTLIIKGELGNRNSTDNTRDGDFADIPFSLSLKKKF